MKRKLGSETSLDLKITEKKSKPNEVEHITLLPKWMIKAECFTDFSDLNSRKKYCPDIKIVSSVDAKELYCRIRKLADIDYFDKLFNNGEMVESKEKVCEMNYSSVVINMFLNYCKNSENIVLAFDKGHKIPTSDIIELCQLGHFIQFSKLEQACKIMLNAFIPTKEIIDLYVTNEYNIDHFVKIYCHNYSNNEIPPDLHVKFYEKCFDMCIDPEDKTVKTAVIFKLLKYYVPTKSQLELLESSKYNSWFKKQIGPASEIIEEVIKISDQKNIKDRISSETATKLLVLKKLLDIV